MKYEHIIRALGNTYWAILPSKLTEIIGIIEARASGITVDIAAMKEYSAKRQAPIRHGRVAVLPIIGTIAHRGGTTQSSMGTSSEAIGNAFDMLMASSDVGGIVLDIKSPGGVVHGVQELAAKIYAARGVKPVVAVANAIAASAAFWIGTAADSFAVTPSGEVGSVGVIMAHLDHSAQLDQDGIKATFITSAKFKAEGNPTEPLSAETVEFEQSQVDAYDAVFVKDLAKHRDTTVNRVKHDFGEGRMVMAQDAVARNMVDRVATLETVLDEMTGKVQPRRRSALSARRELELTK